MIHRFQVLGEKYLYDSNSGSLHAIDDVVWDVLDHYPAATPSEVVVALGGVHGPEAVAAAISELEELRRQGLVWAPDPYPGGYAVADHGVKALCLHLAHDCNLACTYCFADGGPFGGDRSLMPFEVARAAIDFLVAGSPERDYFEVDFFGGEPLLNFDVLKQTVAYADSLPGKRFRFTVTTNCVLLNDEVRSFLNDRGMQVILSLDGRPEVHDAMRRDRGGRGSYERAVKNAQALVASRSDGAYRGEGYYARGTFTRQNLDFTADVRHLLDLGFRSLSLEPVIGLPSDPYAIRSEDVRRISEEYERLAAYYLERSEAGEPFTFFHFMLDPSGGACAAKRVIGCGAGWEYVAVAPNGDIYPCHQFVGRRAYLLGNVRTGIARRDIGDRFRATTIYSKPECSQCWARFLCSGGCHANADLISRDIGTPYRIGCELQKRRLECALHIQAKQSETGL